MTIAVRDIAEQLRGVSYAKSDVYSEPRIGFLPVLRANNITDEGLTFVDLVYVPASRVSPKQLLRSGDVVVAASSGSIDVVGKAAELRQNFVGGFGAFCKVLRPNKEIVDPAYFSHFFRTPAYRKRISALAAGANINNLKNEHLDDLEIPLPPLDEQRRIAAVLDKADALRRKRIRALHLLDSLTQSIFLKMFGNSTHSKMVPLADLIDGDDRINYGVVQPGEDVSEGIYLVRVSDLKSGHVNHLHLRKVSREINEQYGRSVLRGNEILISCVGSIGEIAVATTLERGFVDLH